MKRRVLSAIASVVVVLGVPGIAFAAWGSGGSGHGYSAAYLMPTGPTPSVSVSGRNVTVSWTAAQFPNSTSVNAYVVKRYDLSNNPQTVGANCAGSITALSCTENGVAPGTWKYTITAKQASWLGPEGAKSANAVVQSPSLTFSSPTTIAALPTTLNGNVASFLTGETLTFRLDNAVSGTVLSSTATPSTIPTNGQSAITVTIPQGTTQGAHTVFAIGSSGSQASAGITVLPNDSVPPTVTASIIGKTAGGVGGYVRQAGTYYIYANVTDAGSPATGVSTVRANVTNVTTGSTNVALTAGSFTVQGVSYNYRSASLTATNPLTAGTKTYTVTATDVGGNGATQGGFSVIVDNTTPTAVDVQTTNVGGGTTGLAQTGDTITFTFSEAMDPYIILANWTGTSTTVTLRLVQNGGGDRVQIFNPADTTALPLGTVFLNQTTYTTATRSFTNSTMVMSGSTITVTLGTPSGAVTTAAATAASQWTPSATATDYAGNAGSTTTANESGAADKEF